MIKGAIFDMDGTLIDSMHIWRNLCELYIRSLGFEPKEKFKTYDLDYAADYIRREYGVSLSNDEIGRGVIGIIENFYRDQAVPRPGIPEFLEKLRASGVKMCIATATDRYMVETALERCGIREYFSEIFTVSEVGHEKDEPVIFRKALEYLGTPKNETIVIEDALYAIRTATSDGFLTAAVYDPNEKGQDEVRRLADYYMKDYIDTDGFFAFCGL